MTANALQPFHELGLLVESRWRAADYDERRLPEIAETALREVSLPGRADPWNALRGLRTAEPLPEQRDRDARFSDLPLTVYNGSRFYIDLYYWLDGTTEIHQHAFAGAFQVFTGSSLHSRYAFARKSEINPHFLTGCLSLKGVEILTAGDIRQIHPGTEFVHSLFHLERPSITLTVRSQHTPTAAPQYAYLKPFFAIDPFHQDPARSKKVQAASLLLKMRHPEAQALVGDLLAESDFQTAFHLIETATSLLTDRSLGRALGLAAGEDLMRDLIERARARHGSLLDLVTPVLDERRRQSEIARRRSAITSDEHRFLLALLLNVTDRTTVIDLVARRFPERDAVETIVDWVQELGTTKELGASGNVLGIAGWDDDHVFVFECLLRGLSEAGIAIEITRQYPNAHGPELQARAARIATPSRTPPCSGPP